MATIWIFCGGKCNRTTEALNISRSDAGALPTNGSRPVAAFAEYRRISRFRCQRHGYQLTAANIDLLYRYATAILNDALRLTDATDAFNGDPFNGDPFNGDPLNGDPLNGDPLNGDPLNGDPLSGYPFNGEVMTAIKER